MTVVKIKKGRERSLLAQNPWVFSGAIEKMSAGITDGDLVTVQSAKGELLGVGFYSTDNIAVKLLAFSKEAESFQSGDSLEALFERKIAAATQRRKVLGLLDDPLTNAFRLVNAEGDLLPGLVVDVYGEHAVLQLHSRAMQRNLALIEHQLLKALPQLRSISVRLHRTLQDQQHPQGESKLQIIKENGLHFEVDDALGQKTGFFIDQRENRDLVGRHSRGAAVLNAFCYTGGFTVSALAGGAEKVVSIDTSAGAVSALERNVQLNFSDLQSRRSQAVVGDCFTELEKIPQLFDLVVLDPPAFAKHRKAISGALRGYEQVNLQGIKRLRPGGKLFTFSCSQLISSEDFIRSVALAASHLGRTLHVVKELQAASCHHRLVSHPEGRYLKGLFAIVE